MLPFRCASNGQVRIAAVLRDQNHRLTDIDAAGQRVLGHHAQLIQETS
jgi:hypothetical protein